MTSRNDIVAHRDLLYRAVRDAYRKQKAHEESAFGTGPGGPRSAYLDQLESLTELLATDIHVAQYRLVPT